MDPKNLSWYIHEWLHILNRFSLCLFNVFSNIFCRRRKMSNCTQTSDHLNLPFSPLSRKSRTFSLRLIRNGDHYEYSPLSSFRLRSKTLRTTSPLRRKPTTSTSSTSMPSCLLALSTEINLSKSVPASKYKVTTV